MDKPENIDKELSDAKLELQQINARRDEIQRKIDFLKAKHESAKTCVKEKTSFSESEKIMLFRSLFKGREDVYPRRFESRKTGKSGYQPACGNEWVPGICRKPKVKCAECEHRKLLAVTDTTIRNHLLGQDNTGKDFTIGVYPLLENETCWFLAADFDKKDWAPDVKAFAETCRKLKVPVAIERSRSGNGAHAWIFFSEPIPAVIARQMGTHILTETMEQRPELGFDSYDRFFPNQDTLPQGGFGNLIALPLQAKPRRDGNSVFIDDNLLPFPDQWQFLAGIQKMMVQDVTGLAKNAIKNGRVTGVKMIVEEDDDPPWEQPPSRKRKEKPLTGAVPEKLDIVLENQIYFPKKQLPSSLKTRLIRIAAFQNPEFYKTQAMRLPVYNKPRIISCSEEFPEHIGIPRGCADDIAQLLISLKIKFNVDDKRNFGKRHDFSFTGELRLEQQDAVNAILPYDLGVLSASTAFGKTVVAINLLAQRKVNTLILVHRVQLIDQWLARLQSFLEIPSDLIGVIGGGKRNLKGIIDVATIQSLVKKGVVDDVVADYGHIIVDECHHLSAFSFERVARQCKARFFLGLSATPSRKDGHHPIIFMQCGPIRFKVCDRKQAAERPFQHRVVVRETDIQLPDDLKQETTRTTIHQIYALLIADQARNDLIVNDILSALRQKRSPVVITERKGHLNYLFSRLDGKVKNLIVLKGGIGKKALRSIIQLLKDIPDDEERVLLATGKYLGEGFDDARLDTLLLTMPVSWKGTLSQYAGRLHRLHDRKTEVIIYDYADLEIPVTARMFQRRCEGYKAIGYEINDSNTHQPLLLPQ